MFREYTWASWCTTILSTEANCLFLSAEQHAKKSIKSHEQQDLQSVQFLKGSREIVCKVALYNDGLPAA